SQFAARPSLLGGSAIKVFEVVAQATADAKPVRAWRREIGLDDAFDIGCQLGPQPLLRFRLVHMFYQTSSLILTLCSTLRLRAAGPCLRRASNGRRVGPSWLPVAHGRELFIRQPPFARPSKAARHPRDVGRHDRGGRTYGARTALATAKAWCTSTVNALE